MKLLQIRVSLPVGLHHFQFLCYRFNGLVCYRQGDLIGRIYAIWAIIYFRQVFENRATCTNYGASLYTRKKFLFILTKYGLGFILGHFLLLETSGHPGCRLIYCMAFEK
jgi:hypothetical protein